MARIEVNEEEGLIDSGATHSLRGWRRSDRHKRLKDIQVTLAGGRTMNLKITTGGTMISEDPNTEPIVPMGKMISRLGCTLGWTKDDGLIVNPFKGVISTKSRGGCPYIDKAAALELIEELDAAGEDEADEAEDQELKRIKKLDDQEEEWLRSFIYTNPVFKKIPTRLKEELVRRAGDNFCWNPGGEQEEEKAMEEERTHPSLVLRWKGGFQS